VQVQDRSLLDGFVLKQGNWNRFKKAQEKLFPCEKTI
jgi:hypothetical protein